MRNVNVYFDANMANDVDDSKQEDTAPMNSSPVPHSEKEDADYLSMRDKFFSALTKHALETMKSDNSNMNIYYKSGLLGKKYTDVMDYIQKKKIRMISLNDSSVDKFEKDVVYQYRCPCSFAIEDDNGYAFVRVTIEVNGIKVSAKTSRDKWMNFSIVSCYTDCNNSRYCTCYFILDQGKVFHFLQIGEA